MIDKVMRQRKKGRSARGALGYILADGKARLVLFNPILHELDFAADLMEAVAKGNKRVKKPFYHFALAWPNADAPTEQQMQQVMQGALQRLGMLEHQWVAAVHDDAGHPHIHTVVNRVHPDTYRCASTSYDFFKLGQYATEIERRYGWMELRRYGAPGARIQIGALMLYERDLLPRCRTSGRGLTPTEAAFQTWLRKEMLQSLVTAAGSIGQWRDVLATIGRHGVRYVASDGGARFVDAVDSSISIAASSVARVLSLPSLEKRLGAFENAPVAVDVTRAFACSVAAIGLSAVDPYRKLLSQYNFEKQQRREQTRVMRRDAWASQRSKEVACRAEIREAYRDRLRDNRKQPKDARLKARAQILVAKNAALEELNRRHNCERERLRAELRRVAKPEPWSKFVQRLVHDDNAAAIAYLQTTKWSAQGNQTISPLSGALEAPALAIRANATADQDGKMQPLVAANESVPERVKQIATTSITGHLSGDICVQSPPEDVEPVRMRLRRMGKPRSPKLAL